MNRFLAFFTILTLLISSFLSVSAQNLKPGFVVEEYRNLMYISARTTAAPSYYKDFPEPEGFKMVYQSPAMGLDNLWDLWTKENKIAVVSLRGTTAKQESWLANFYAAMVPARGELKINRSETFKYDLASNPRAAVHVGWLLSLAYLSKDILPKIDSCYKQGIKDFILMGHSQGAAVNFLLTAYLYKLRENGKLPADIRFKTYCSAGPKPGNLYFAYEYEAMTQEGWAYNVVNTSDWVPETPISIQTANDFNTTNPFVNAKPMIKKQKFPKNLVFKHLYNKLDKPTKKAQKSYEKYLGRMVAKLVIKNLPEFVPPAYVHTSNYMRAGATIVLTPDSAYYKQFPDNADKIFTHHFHDAYLYLLKLHFK